MKEITKLFVYGTLGPGRPNEHILNNIGGSWEEGTVDGHLHKEGWGSEMGFPGITLDENGNKIEGFVFSSAKILEHWPELDNFEGDGYQRIVTAVELKDNSFVDAYIYALKRTK